VPRTPPWEHRNKMFFSQFAFGPFLSAYKAKNPGIWLSKGVFMLRRVYLKAKGELREKHLVTMFPRRCSGHPALFWALKKRLRVVLFIRASARGAPKTPVRGQHSIRAQHHVVAQLRTPPPVWASSTCLRDDLYTDDDQLPVLLTLRALKALDEALDPTNNTLKLKISQPTNDSP
jgi:hypothetical protein